MNKNERKSVVFFLVSFCGKKSTWKSDDLHISTVHLLVLISFQDHEEIVSELLYDHCQ